MEIYIAKSFRLLEERNVERNGGGELNVPDTNRVKNQQPGNRINRCTGQGSKEKSFLDMQKDYC